MKVFLLVAALMLTSSASAADLSATMLPGDSRWYVHVNIDNMRASPLGEHLFEESIGEAFGDIQEELGVALEADVHAVTVFGSSLPPSVPAVILHGALSAETRASIQAVMEDAGSYAELQYAGSTYYAIDELEGRHHKRGHNREATDDVMLVAFGPVQTMVTPDEGAIQRFLEAGGESRNGVSADPHAMIVLQAERAILQGGMDASGIGGGENFKSSILNNISQLAGVIADENGGLRVQVEIEASSEETAAYVHNVLQGLASLKALDAADEPGVAAALQALRIQTTGRRVELKVVIESALVNELMDE